MVLKRIFRSVQICLLVLLLAVPSGLATAIGDLHVTGRVTDSVGDGIANVSVYATAPGDGAVIFGPVTTADGSGATIGSYDLSVIQAGTYDVHFIPPAASGLSPIVATGVNVTDNQVVNVQLSPARSNHTFSGYVRDTSGNPVAGLSVRSNAGDARTDSTGHFSIFGSGTITSVGFLTDGARVGNMGLLSSLQFGYGGLAINLANADAAQDFTLHMAHLRVTVKDSAGVPQPSRPIYFAIFIQTSHNISSGSTIVSSNGNDYSSAIGSSSPAGATTNSDGVADVLVPQGLIIQSNFMSVTFADGSSTSNADTITVSSDTNYTLTAPPPRHTFSGTVTDAAGNPVQGLSITNGSGGTTDAAGRYSFTGTGLIQSIGFSTTTGTHVGNAKLLNNLFMVDQAVSADLTNADATRDFTLHLVHLHITVTDTNGAPEPSRPVLFNIFQQTSHNISSGSTIISSGGTDYAAPISASSQNSTTTDSNGVVDVLVPQGLIIQPGFMYVSFANGGEATNSDAITMSSDVSLTFAAPANRHTFSGTVRDTAGHPISGLLVNGTVRTDSTGHFSMTGSGILSSVGFATTESTFAGTARLLDDLQFGGPVVPIDLTNGDVTQDFTLHLASLSVTVKDSSGNPEPARSILFNIFQQTSHNISSGNTVITAGDTDANVPIGATSQSSATTDSNGVATVFVPQGLIIQPNFMSVSFADGGYVSNANVVTMSGNVSLLFQQTAPITVLTPTGLTAATPTHTAPALSWDAVPGADHYDIFRDNTKVGSSPASNYTDTAAAEGSHSYYVVALDNAGHASQPSNSITVVVDKTGPVVSDFGPFAKTVLDDFALTVPASDALTQVAAGEYYVGSTDPGIGSGLPMSYANGSLTAPSSDVTLKNLPAGTYTLHVRARDTVGNWTAPVANGQLTVVLPAPTGLAADTPTNNAPVLTWNAVPTATSYKVYRLDTSTNTKVLAGTATATNFTDNYVPGIFNYTVVAVDAGGVMSAESAAFQVVVSGSLSTAARSVFAQNKSTVRPVFGDDTLPGLVASSTTDANFDFSLSLKTAGGVDIKRDLTFSYNTPSSNFFVTSTGIDWLIINGTNNSVATFQGVSTVVRNGVTTTNVPFTVVATDGAAAGNNTSDRFTLTLYNDASRSTVLYKVSQNLANGKVKVN